MHSDHTRLPHRMSNGVQAGTAVALAGVFLGLGWYVHSGATRRFDDRLLIACRNPADLSDAIGPKWFEQAGRDITALGGTAVLVILTVCAAIYLGMVRRWQAFWQVILTCSLGYGMMEWLKVIYDRPRPDVVPHLSYVASASFPSGHAMMSTVIYLTLARVASSFAGHRSQTVFFYALATLLILLVGASRVYEGVHFPTDVVAGWSAGSVWAILCGLIARIGKSREKPPVTSR